MSIYKMEKIILALLLAGSLSSAAWATDCTEHQDNSAENASYVDCTFKDITGSGGSGSNAGGGALYNSGTITSITSTNYKTDENGFLTESSSVFKGNNADYPAWGGGAIYNSTTGTINLIQYTIFDTNKGQNAGAITNEGIIDAIKNSSFKNNEGTGASSWGGAIYNSGTIEVISYCSFEENVCVDCGGAISNEGTITSITNSSFYKNQNTGNGQPTGGAIDNEDGTIKSIKECYFIENTSGRGGAIHSTGTIGSIEGSYFVGNVGTFFGGGIYNGAEWCDFTISAYTISSIETCYFQGNEAQAGNGGAIENGWGTSYIGDISNSYFEGNEAKYDKSESKGGNGGAIYNEGTIGSAVDADGQSIVSGSGISNSYFIKNTAEINGGAIYNNYGTFTYQDDEDQQYTINSAANITSITGCYFEGNVATTGSGGAIYNASGIIEGDTKVYTCTIGSITNSSFIGNSAAGNGGAIYSMGDLTIAADSGETIFSGNYTNGTSGKDDNAIYMAKDAGDTASKLEFKLSNKGTIILEDNIRGDAGYSVVISGDSIDTTFCLLNDIYDGDVSIGSTTLSTIDGVVHSYGGDDSKKYYNLKSFTLTNNINMVVDVDLENEEMDRISTDSYTVGSYTLTVSGMNLISDTEKDKVAVYFAEEGLMKNVTAGVSGVPDSNQLTAYTPTYKYNVYYLYDDNGTITYGNNTYNASESDLINSDGGYFIFTKSGFNPAVMGTSIAEAGAYNAFGMVFDYNFEHSDYYMKLPEDVRLAMSEERKQAKKAPKENDPTRNAYYNQHELTYRGAWTRSFFSNESVDYGAWSSRDKYYGAMVGFDTDMKVNENGWATVTTGYAGTLGIRQQYSGGHIKQHGGFVGVTESFYKKNFYNAWTIAAGTMKAHEHTMYGKDKDRIDQYGIATRLGWNIKLDDEGKYTLLPTFTASYTYVHPEDFTNAGGVHIAGSGFRAVQLNPNVKFIINMENGWQPYLTVGEVWTVAESTHLRANGTKLDELDLDPYTEYGIGVQKRWAYDKDAYIQFLGHSHGRDGFLVNAGLRWNF